MSALGQLRAATGFSDKSLTFSLEHVTNTSILFFISYTDKAVHNRKEEEARSLLNDLWREPTKATCKGRGAKATGTSKLCSLSR